MGAVAVFGVALSAIGIYLIWQTFRETRLLTTETARATGVMDRQNQWTENSQRPWIKVDCEVEKAEIVGPSFVIRCKITATNIGKSVAENCGARGRIIDGVASGVVGKKVEELRQEARKASLGEAGEGLSPYPLIPGESVDFYAQTQQFFAVSARSGDVTRRIILTLFVAVRYCLPGETIMRETDRTFFLCYGATEDDRNDPFSDYGIPTPVPRDLSTETVFLASGGSNRTT